MTWKTCRLGDFVILQRGHDLPESQRQPGDVPVVSSSGITGRHNASKAKAPGVVTGRYGTLGEVFYVEEDYWPLNTALYVTDFKGSHPRFVAYFLRNVLQNYQSDKAAVPGINRNVLHELRIRVPGSATQERIVDFLSAYDDLIKNSRRRMALLEEAAKQLYEEWFVRLRFPGFEHTETADGVPRGWERKTLRQLCESVDYGYTASADQEEIGPRFLRITDIVPEFIDWATVPFCTIEDDRHERFRLREGDIVIARTGATVGYAKRLHKRHPETVFASYLVRLRPRQDIENLLLGVFIKSQAYKDYVRSRVGRRRSRTQTLKCSPAAEILVPGHALQSAFREFVEPLVDQREILQVQNQKLPTPETCSCLV